MILKQVMSDLQSFRHVLCLLACWYKHVETTPMPEHCGNVRIQFWHDLEGGSATLFDGSRLGTARRGVARRGVARRGEAMRSKE